MFCKLKRIILSTSIVINYRKILPYVKPYWKRALLAVLITVPIGAMDAIIAWSLKPYMDVVMLEQQATAIQTAIIPLLIILFSSLQSIFNYTVTYMNTWVGQKISQDVKIDLFDKLMHYNAAYFDKKIPEIFYTDLTKMWILPVVVYLLILNFLQHAYFHHSR